MNKVKQRTLALFVVLALLLGGALALVNHQNQQEAAAASAAAEGTIPLSAFPMDSLSRLVLETGGETLTLEAGESWTLEEDPDYHLDATACDSMRTALSALNAKRQLTAETGEDYGFDAPQAVVTVTADGETHTFRFGAENTITGDVYLQKDEDPAVYTVAASKAAPFLTSKAALFGAFCPAGLTRSDIEAVSYTLASGETVTLQAVSEPVPAAENADSAADKGNASSTEYQTVWRLAADPEEELDTTKTDALLSALSSYVSAQITNADPADYGFSAPLATAKVTTASGTVTLTYAMGTDGYYLMISGEASVYAVDGTTVQALLPADQLKAG